MTSDAFWTEARFKMAATAGGAVLFVVIAVVGFGHDLYLPKRPPRPKAEAFSTFSERVDSSEDAWKGYAESDARVFHLPTFDLADMTKAFEYRIAEPDTLLDPEDGSRSLEAAGLHLEVEARGRPPREMLVLRIKNTTRHPLAYRVGTAPSRGTQSCRDKTTFEHNAIAVGPGETVERTECVYREGLKLRIKRVETLDVPPLSLYYVSRLPPAQVGYDTRVAEGHKCPRPCTSLCSVIFDGTLQQDIDSGKVAWRNVIDFYARHRCETYTFPRSYTHFKSDDERTLPAVGARR